MGDFFFGVDPIEVLQRFATPFLDALFVVITSTGSLPFFLAAMVLVYWLWDKRLGLFLGVLLLVSGAVNAYLKAFFGQPRPPSELHKPVPLTSNGFPSGHAQTTTAFWSALALVRRGGWIPVAVVMVVLVALSRVYLGVHFVGDVLGGVAIGLALGLVGYAVYQASFWRRLGTLHKLVLAVVLPAAFGGVLTLLGEEAFLFGGLLTGLSVGYVLEGEWVGLKRAGNVETGVLRVALGLPSVGGLALLGVRLADPVLVLPFFFALGLAVALVLPWAFARLEAVWLRQGR
jgi:membrane-associated phospholipid phosphatase